MRSLVILVLVTLALFAQGPTTPPAITATTVTPAGACSVNQGRLVGPGGAIYTCQSGTWAQAGGGSSSVNVNGSPVANPNFNGTTPAAGSGNTNVTFQVSGSSVSGEVPNTIGTATFGATTGAVTLTLASGNIFTAAMTPTGNISGITLAGVPSGISQLIFQWTMGATPYTASSAPTGFNTWCPPVQTANLITSALFETADGGTTWNMLGCVSNSTTAYFGSDNVSAGILQIANGSAAAYTTLKSAATTSNEVDFFAVVPTTGHLLDCTVSSVVCTLHDSGVVTANVVQASSPGAGYAHFAGSTQTVTSQAIPAADIPATALSTPGTSFTLAPHHAYGVCTGTCTVTVLAPAAGGDDFCVVNDIGVSTAITISGQTGVFFSKPDRSAYGASGGSFTITAVAGNSVCMFSRDATHWIVADITGAGTAN